MKEVDEGAAELESQFVLRLPIEPAKVLKEALRNCENLKDRFNIKIEENMRHAEVRLDHWLLPGKIVDLPTIIESLKTIDSKSFYKTADICQMLLCKEEDDQKSDDESPQKKKKDPYKVDKKYLWPHGVTPPAKNVRRRRFRKTLKKKYVEAPEIEKEVKRLLRVDNDAVSVKWEVINEDDENKVNKGTVVIKKEIVDPEQPKVAEHDIFGGDVSDSDDEEAHLNVLDVIDDNSQNSGDDSHLTDSNSVLNTSIDQKQLITEFTSDMFEATPTMLQDVDYYGQSSSNISYSEPNLTKATVETKLEALNLELNDIKSKRIQQEIKIENIENIALRQRFQENVERLMQDQIEKEHDIYEMQEILKQFESTSF